MEYKPDNFDKEFSMTKNKKASPQKGKIPSWLMILAGAAVIAGVVIARQPFIRSADNGTRASINVQETNSITVNTAAFSGLNDEQVDSSELEARFISRNNGADFQYIVPANMTAQGFNMEMDPLDVDENGYVIYPADEEKDASIYWVDGKPYAVTILPRENAEASAEDTETSYYKLNDKDYEVNLQPVSDSEIAALSSEEMGKLISAEGRTYLLQMTAVGEDTTALTEPTMQKTDAGSAGADINTPTPTAVITDKSAENLTVQQDEEASTAVVWLNNKAYSVTVKPYREDTQETAKNEPAVSETEAVNETTEVPAQESIRGENTNPAMIESNENKPAAEPEPVTAPQPEKEAQVSVFTTAGKTYELTLTELSEEEGTERSASQPVIWLGETPLQVEVLTGANEAGEEAGTQGAQPIEISLNPLSAEQTAVLQQERYGKDFIDRKTVQEPTSTPTTAPTPEPTAVPEEDNWFVSMFNNIFGSNPTPTPTVEVVIVLPTATPTVPLPTAEPIIVRMVPTATQQGPMRLDATATSVPTAAATITPVSKDSESIDPALIDVDDETPEPTETGGQTAVTETEGWITPAVAEFRSNGETQEPAVQATPEELPHTGMAEGWNIPSMLALLAGLLLVIIGVRRLRSSRN